MLQELWDLTTMKSIWSYTTGTILPSKINNKTEFFVIHKTYSSFLNNFCSVSVAFALKESSSKRRTVILLN